MPHRYQVKSIFAPHLGRHVKLGRHRPVARGPRLSLKSYINKLTLPAPPPAVDYSQPALSALRNIYDNDTLGDCVVAMGYHFEATTTGNAGNLYTATDQEIIKDYSAIGGYVPGDPSTDQGCDEQTAFNYWTQNGFANGTKLLGYIAVDPNNVTELKQALYLFENLLFGVELPDGWVSPFPSADGFVWDVAQSDPQNGHAFLGIGYNDKGIAIDTWGLFGTLTYSAIASLCTAANGGEVYVGLTPDLVAKGQAKAPNGFAWNDLIADFQALGGNVPNPTPAPAPSPSPSPAPAPSGVTLAQVQAWAAEGIANHWPVSKL